MNLRIKRRRFGQIALASAAAAATANLADKTLAQSQPVIYGARLGAPATPPKAAINATTNFAGATTDAPNTTPRIVVESLNLTTGQQISTSDLPQASVQNRQVADPTADSAVAIASRERLTGFTTLADGTFLLATVATTDRGSFTRLSFGDSKSSRSGLKVSGLQRNSTVENLLSTKDGRLLTILSLYQGTPPFEVAVLDSKTGRVSSSNELPAVPENRRLSNLTQAPDGTIYATAVGMEGSTDLVQVDLTNRAIATGRGQIIYIASLTFNHRTLDNDLAGLAFSPSNQLFALADPNYEGTNSLFSVDIKTGAMTWLRQFAVEKISFGQV